jgi:hypothetical protein
MTVKLADYGISGSWVMADCDGCGKRRSCLTHMIPDGPDGYDYLNSCVLCLVKDIEQYERGLRAGEEEY